MARRKEHPWPWWLYVALAISLPIILLLIPIISTIGGIIAGVLIIIAIVKGFLED